MPLALLAPANSALAIGTVEFFIAGPAQGRDLSPSNNRFGFKCISRLQPLFA